MSNCICDPTPMSCGGEGLSESCEIHGRPYHEWVERGDILNARLDAVKAVIAKVRRTPTSNDPYRIALEIADDLEAAVYLEPKDRHMRALPAGDDPTECCSSGRCEVCVPGFDWWRVA